MKYILSILIIVLISSPGFSGIVIDQEVLYRGQEVTITTDEPVDTIKITYRPNSQVTSKASLTSANPTTTFQWTPAEAGIVAITAGSSSTTVSVRFEGVSWSGIAIMLIAGFLLFGGATYAFRLLMYGKPPEALDADLIHRADT